MTHYVLDLGQNQMTSKEICNAFKKEGISIPVNLKNRLRETEDERKTYVRISTHLQGEYRWFIGYYSDVPDHLKRECKWIITDTYIGEL